MDGRLHVLLAADGQLEVAFVVRVAVPRLLALLHLLLDGIEVVAVRHVRRVQRTGNGLRRLAEDDKLGGRLAGLKGVGLQVDSISLRAGQSLGDVAQRLVRLILEVLALAADDLAVLLGYEQAVLFLPVVGHLAVRVLHPRPAGLTGTPRALGLVGVKRLFEVRVEIVALFPFALGLGGFLLDRLFRRRFGRRFWNWFLLNRSGFRRGFWLRLFPRLRGRAHHLGEVRRVLRAHPRCSGTRQPNRHIRLLRRRPLRPNIQFLLRRRVPAQQAHDAAVAALKQSPHLRPRRQIPPDAPVHFRHGVHDLFQHRPHSHRDGVRLHPEVLGEEPPHVVRWNH